MADIHHNKPENKTAPASKSYAVARHSVLAKYSDAISGSEAGIFLVISSDELSDAAKNALTKTAESLNYGPNPITFVQTSLIHADRNSKTSTNSSASSHKQTCESPESQLFEIIEGLDPVCMVLCDEDAASLVSKAYNADITSMSLNRIFGRSVAVLDHIDTLLATPQGKSRMWGILRILPHFHEA